MLTAREILSFGARHERGSAVAFANTLRVRSSTTPRAATSPPTATPRIIFDLRNEKSERVGPPSTGQGGRLIVDVIRVGNTNPRTIETGGIARSRGAHLPRPSLSLDNTFDVNLDEQGRPCRPS